MEWTAVALVVITFAAAVLFKHITMTAYAEKGTGMELKKVFICSPLRPVADDKDERAKETKKNLNVARAASSYALQKYAIPMAPHLYFPQILKEDDPDQRELGIDLGLIWLMDCDEVWVIGRRVSEGMQKEIEAAKKLGIPIRRYVFPRTRNERILDAIYYPNIDFREMTL